MSTRRIVLLAHNIRSLWNIGSMFRTADAFGVSEVVLTGYTSTPPRAEISKTALGAENHVSWRKEEDPLVAIQQVRTQYDCFVIALETSPTAVVLPEVTVEQGRNVCIIVGHEILGVPDALQAAADVTARIPMLGTKSSLNVSTATAVALYHVACLC